tara:strand:+ start:1088 stop:1396 length:309 start_codon:yes stop_codon:yes gene_type:complete
MKEAMKKEVTAAILESAIATKGNICETCILAQTFGVTVGFDFGTYRAFGPGHQDEIFAFDEKGQKIADLFDEGIANGDKVMSELRAMLPCDVELGVSECTTK